MIDHTCMNLSVACLCLFETLDINICLVLLIYKSYFSMHI